jgi:hypothetical protein
VTPVGIGEVMRALGVGQVIVSNNPKFAVGDYVNGALGVQDYFLGEPRGFYKVDPKLAPLPRYLSALGMTGMTAYFALLDTGAPKAGETVVISGAAGAVGSIAGQIAKIKGCRVVGIAGGADKCKFLVDELGFDAAIDNFPKFSPLNSFINVSGNVSSPSTISSLLLSLPCAIQPPISWPAAAKLAA